MRGIESSYGFGHQSRRQMGITFPPASQQENILVIRIDLEPTAAADPSRVKEGTRKLCGLIEMILNGTAKMDILTSEKRLESVELSKFNFSATVGFGIGFFDKLGIEDSNRPRNLFGMPNNTALGDSLPYVIPQTDMIVQLCSSHEYVNKWTLSNSDYDITTQRDRFLQPYQTTKKQVEDGEKCDIVTSLRGWAVISDIHSGFQRHDGRNLMGFPDGISQPSGKLRDNIVWTTRDDEIPKLTDGTYMVFQKIEHDLKAWQLISVEDQERWIGRSKATGLLLGTLSREEDRRLAGECKSSNPIIRKRAQERLKMLLDFQRNPDTKLFNGNDYLSRRILRDCPADSHVRMTNPRGEGNTPFKIIYRRGYLFMEDTVLNGGILKSGLLFICFQRDIRNGFEYIKKFFFKSGLSTVSSFQSGKHISRKPRSFATHNYLENNLSIGDHIVEPEYKSNSLPTFSTLTIGGGYYYIPPIPNNKVTDIGQQFFH